MFYCHVRFREGNGWLNNLPPNWGRIRIPPKYPKQPVVFLLKWVDKTRIRFELLRSSLWNISWESSLLFQGSGGKQILKRIFLVGAWTNPSYNKKKLVKLGSSSPIFRGEHAKNYLSCHHLALKPPTDLVILVKKKHCLKDAWECLR